MNLKSSKTRLNKMRKDLAKFIKKEVNEQGLSVGSVSVIEDTSTKESNTYVGCSKNFGLKFYKLVNLDNSYSPVDIYKLALIFVNLLKTSMLEDAFYLSTSKSYRDSRQKDTPEEIKACQIVNDLREIRDEQSRVSTNN